MALLHLTSPFYPILKNPTTSALPKTHHPSLSLSLLPPSANPKYLRRLYSTIRFYRHSPSDLPDPSSSDDEEEPDKTAPTTISDEWGEKSDPDPEPPTKLADSDPPKDEDEWGTAAATGEDYAFSGNGSAAATDVDVSGDKDDNKIEELKRCLVDSVYGTDLGFSASSEVRAEVLELVSQLEAVNPIPVPTDAVEELDGNWILLYTAFSELLPLLAAGTTPLLKVEKICQSINTSSLIIDNSVKFSSPFATFSFSASAAFEVRSPSRIQVQFKEGTLQPPEMKSSINLPENVNIFGQTINLSPVQQSLNPLQEAVAGIALAISGQPPVKIPIPGERPKSWLLITYLDKDLRISRGDGGLFVLAKDGSPLLDSWKYDASI